MPLVRIDLWNGVAPERRQQIADVVHDALVVTFGIPERDRFQIMTEHAREEIIAEDAGLGFERSAGVVIIQIFTQRGRTSTVKQRLYRQIAAGLAAIDIAGEDVFIGYQENGPEDWSFGFGQAQYLTGELEPLGA